MSDHEEADPQLKKTNIFFIGIVSPIIITVSILYGLGII
jgi:hypothetical protein